MTDEEMQNLRDRIKTDIDAWWDEYDWDGKFKTYVEGLSNER